MPSRYPLFCVLYDVFFRGGAQTNSLKFRLWFEYRSLEEIPHLGRQWCLLRNPAIQFA